MTDGRRVAHTSWPLVNLPDDELVGIAPRTSVPERAPHALRTLLAP